MTVKIKSDPDFASVRDPLSAYLVEFCEHLRRANLSQTVIERVLSSARHFLLWMRVAGLAMAHIDDAVLQRFRDHDCNCRRHHKSWRPGKNPRTRKVMAGVLRFVDFLEQNGHTDHPGELDEANRLLERFAERLTELGYRSIAANKKRSTARHFLFWLHRSRISMGQLDATAVRRFFEHDCVCGESFRGVSDTEGGRNRINRIVEFLVLQGHVTDASLMPPDKTKPQLSEFAQWLHRHRGIQPSTVAQHVRQVCSLLPLLGDPAQYDAARIRNALLHRFQSCSVQLAWALAGSMRMYLRFLSAKGVCSAALVSSVPSVRRWKRSSLPRYLLPEQIEQLIATCDAVHPAGLRDRAMFLLMARLGLRPGDVMALRFEDIDWSNATVRVCGKSRHAVALPLPQDAGDAVLEYLEKARPKIGEERIFLTASEPYRALGNVCTISNRVSKSLQRAAIKPVGNQGAGLFRHSVASALLREGATLNEIQTLLRHRCFESTAIYAKVDMPMLQSVTQPWLGGEK